METAQMRILSGIHDMIMASAHSLAARSCSLMYFAGLTLKNEHAASGGNTCV
jgi:hypothetical protein